VLTVVNSGEVAPAASVVSGSLIDEIVREGARRMLAAALEAEVAAYVAAHVDEGQARRTSRPRSSSRGRIVKIFITGLDICSGVRPAVRWRDFRSQKLQFSSWFLLNYLHLELRIGEGDSPKHSAMLFTLDSTR
jgi:hypothetical protein